MFLVTKLPGAGPVYCARDTDGTMKHITFAGTLFEKDLPSDPWYRVEKISDEAAEAHKVRLETIANEKLEKQAREVLTNEAAQTMARYETIVCPLRVDADKEIDERATFMERYVDDASYRAQVLSEIEERAGAEEKRKVRSRQIIEARARLEEEIGDMLSDPENGSPQDRQKKAAASRLDFERRVLAERIKTCEDAGDEEAAGRLKLFLEQTYPLEPTTAPAAPAAPPPEGGLTIDKKKKGRAAS